MSSGILAKTEWIAISARSGDYHSEVYERFGRAYWFLLYNPAEGHWQAFNNENNRALTSEAGVATVHSLLDLGVRVVLTGETGPKAFRALTAAGVIVVHDVAGYVEEAMQSWIEGRLTPAEQPNDPGSPNCLLRRSNLTMRRSA